MVSNRKILQKLRILQRELEVVPDINKGGCGVIAALVGKELQKMGIPCEVVTPESDDYYCSRPAAEARNGVTDPTNPRDWDDNGLNRGHLALRFRLGGHTYTWDSDHMHRGSMRFGWTSELYNTPRYTASGKWGTGLTIAECDAMSAKQKGWNTEFKRKHIPSMRSIVKAVLH